MRRLIRLYPLYLLATLLGAAALSLSGQGERAALVALLSSLLLLPVQSNGALPDFLYPFVSPAWSLFWELLVNLMLALLYPWIRRALPWLAALGIALLAWTAWGYGTLDVGPSWRDFSGGGGRVVYSFFIGVALFHLHGRIGRQVRLPDWLLAGALVAMFMPSMAMASGALYDFAVAALLFPALVLFGANARSGGVSRRIGHWLGDCSYALYLLHWPVLLVFEGAAPHLTGQPLVASGSAGAALFVAVSLVVAHVATRWFDGPLRGWLSGQRGKNRPSAITA